MIDQLSTRTYLYTYTLIYVDTHVRVCSNDVCVGYK